MKIIGQAILEAENIKFYNNSLWNCDYKNLGEILTKIATLSSHKWNLDNFRRGSISVKHAQIVSILACLDSGIPCEKYRDIAIVGVNGLGCQANNVEYWSDYVANCRIGARGSLFVGTLPSTPFAEAMITINAHGQSLFFGGEFNISMFKSKLLMQIKLEKEQSIATLLEQEVGE